MRTPTALLLLASLTACASPLPQADPSQAWIDLRGEPGTSLMADRLDRERTSDGRYYQVSPGRHELELRYQFEVSSGGSLSNASGTFQLTCHVRIRYDGFAAGERYRIDARPIVMRPQVLMYDAQRNVVARGDTLGCGPI